VEGLATRRRESGLAVEVGQTALGGDYVLVPLASISVAQLLPVKALFHTLSQLPKLVEGGSVRIGHFAAVSLGGDFHRVILLFRFWGNVKSEQRGRGAAPGPE